MTRFQTQTAFLFLLSTALASAAPHEFRTTITKWQDGKDAAISLTFDDNSINQFRVALPLLDERGFKGTFFVITGDVPGSKYRRSFIGRPPMEIIRESETIPTNRDNALERMSLLVYLGEINSQSAGTAFTRGQFDPLFRTIDATFAKLRGSGITYRVRKGAPIKPHAAWHGENTWEAFRRHGANGHEFGSHTVSHPFLPSLDDANLRYELEKSLADIRAQLGPAHTFSVQCPYGIEDQRIRPSALALYPAARNWVTDDFMTGIMRGNSRDPGTVTNEYVQWQREPRVAVPMETQKAWVDKTLEHGLWLVLVYHGFEEIGYEPLKTEPVREFFDYVKEKEPRLWVATFKEATQYTRQRMSARIVTKQPSADAVEITVTHSLDPARYDLPLTARTTIPPDWKVATFRQGNQTRWLPIHREGPETFVQYRIHPDHGAARIERADGGNTQRVP